MDWNQACAYHANGAISTADLVRIAYELFEGDALEDVLYEMGTVHWSPQVPAAPHTPSPPRA